MRRADELHTPLCNCAARQSLCLTPYLINYHNLQPGGRGQFAVLPGTSEGNQSGGIFPAGQLAYKAEHAHGDRFL